MSGPNGNNSAILVVVMRLQRFGSLIDCGPPPRSADEFFDVSIEFVHHSPSEPADVVDYYEEDGAEGDTELPALRIGRPIEAVADRTA